VPRYAGFGGGLSKSALEDVGGQRLQRLSPERWLPADCFVERNAEAELVAAFVGWLAAELLGRHVARRSEDRTGLREREQASVLRFRFGLEERTEARESEVGDLGGAVSGHQHVVRFEVAVNDPGRVRRVEPTTRGAQQGDPLLHRAVLRGQPSTERLPLDVLHREVDRTVVLPRLEDLNDIGVRQPGHGSRLTQEPLPRLG